MSRSLLIADVVISIENFNNVLQNNTETANSLRENTGDLKNPAKQLNDVEDIKE